MGKETGKRFIVANEECMESGRRLASEGDPWWRHSGGLMGGAMSIGNAYISVYPAYDGEKRPDDLEVGESLSATFRLSGESSTYDIVRVDDGPRPECD
jgi:hypothetical protein